MAKKESDKEKAKKWMDEIDNAEPASGAYSVPKKPRKTTKPKK